MNTNTSIFTSPFPNNVQQNRFYLARKFFPAKTHFCTVSFLSGGSFFTFYFFVSLVVRCSVHMNEVSEFCIYYFIYVGCWICSAWLLYNSTATAAPLNHHHIHSAILIFAFKTIVPLKNLKSHLIQLNIFIALWWSLFVWCKIFMNRSFFLVFHRTLCIEFIFRFGFARI